jgi:hypothetical protein
MEVNRHTGYATRAQWKWYLILAGTSANTLRASPRLLVGRVVTTRTTNRQQGRQDAKEAKATIGEPNGRNTRYTVQRPPTRAWLCLMYSQSSHCAFPGKRAVFECPTAHSYLHGKTAKSIWCARAVVLDQLICDADPYGRESSPLQRRPRAADADQLHYQTRPEIPQQAAERTNGYSRCQMTRS